MARINPKLLAKIMKKRNVGHARAYALIDKAGQDATLPPNIAALIVAKLAGINISRFASPEELAQVRDSNRPSTHTPSVTTHVPIAPATPVRRARARAVGKKKIKGNKVWVVYGRNEKLRKSLFDFLRSVGLAPIEWNSALALTKKGSPYVGEVVDAGFGGAVATVVLLTPDDEAKLKDEFFKSKSDPRSETKLVGQPRPNVLFEAGMAFGLHPNNTVLVQVGKIRPISDLTGRHINHLNDSVASRQQLIVKLKSAGCPVDDTGSDWHIDGDFKAPK
jgi:predicted nucleotide-binding protein